SLDARVLVGSVAAEKALHRPCAVNHRLVAAAEVARLNVTIINQRRRSLLGFKKLLLVFVSELLVGVAAISLNQACEVGEVVLFVELIERAYQPANRPPRFP